MSTRDAHAAKVMLRLWPRILARGLDLHEAVEISYAVADDLARLDVLDAEEVAR